MFGVVLAAFMMLAGCSSSGDQGGTDAATGASADAAEASSSGDTGGDSDAAPATTEPTATQPPPASTAPPPIAQYPADPAQDPVVDLGPPPPAYQPANCPVEAKACVDLTNSMTWLQVDGVVIYGPVQQIAGRDGYRTTPGMHEVLWKNIDHVSSEFGDPMPYATFFTTTGMAFHEGSLTTPSHGCVHLPHQDVTVYWDNLTEGDLVYVFGEAQY